MSRLPVCFTVCHWLFGLQLLGLVAFGFVGALGLAAFVSPCGGFLAGSLHGPLSLSLEL